MILKLKHCNMSKQKKLSTQSTKTIEKNRQETEDNPIAFDSRSYSHKITYPINKGLQFRDKNDPHIEAMNESKLDRSTSNLEFTNKEAIAILAGLFSYIISNNTIVGIIVYIIVRNIQISEKFQLFQNIEKTADNTSLSKSVDTIGKIDKSTAPTLLRQLKDSHKEEFVDLITKQEALKIIHSPHDALNKASVIKLSNKTLNFIDTANMANKNLKISQVNASLKDQQLNLRKSQVIKKLNLSNKETIEMNNELQLIENEISVASDNTKTKILPSESRVKRLLNDKKNNKKALERQLSIY